MKKLLLFILLLIPINIYAYNINIDEYNTTKLIDNNITDNSVKIYYFYGNDCPYSNAFIEFIKNDVVNNYDINLIAFETWSDLKNLNLYNQILEYKHSSFEGTPYIIIGDKVFEGYSESYNNQIISSIKNYKKNKDIINDMNNVSTNKLSKNKTILLICILFIILVLFVFKVVKKKR